MAIETDPVKHPAAAQVPERLLVSLLALGTFAAQLVLRTADDNRLTSWRWVFAGVNPGRLYALVIAAIVLAQLAAMRPLAKRRSGIVLFAWACAIAACLWGEPEVIVDASRYFTQAKHLELHGIGYFLREWGRGILAWTDLPLVPFLDGLVLKLTGEARIGIEAFTTLLFAGSVVVTYRIGKALWDDELGFTAGALLLGIPYLLVQVPLMLVDVPAMFFFTLAVYAMIVAFQRGGRGRILLASAAVTAALLSKYSIALFLSVVPVIAVVHRKRGTSRPIATTAAIALVTAALLAIAVLPRRDVYLQQLRLLLSYQGPGLRRWGESFVSTFAFQVHPFLTAAALLSVWIAFRRKDPLWVIVAAPVLLLVALQVRRSRYLIPAFPMLALMAAYGLQAINAREVRRVLVTSAVLSAWVVAIFGYLPFLEGTSAMNLKNAGRYLDSLQEARVEVITRRDPDSEVNQAISVPLLDLFTRKRIVYREPREPPPADMRLEQSALRFTWEYRTPDYYAPSGDGEKRAIAVISGDVGQPIAGEVASRLRGFRLARTFAVTDRIFLHRTIVDVYRAASPSDPGGTN